MAWGLAGATLDTGNELTHTAGSNPRGLFISSDGTKFYICDRTNKFVYQYTLSTPYDLTSGSYSGLSKDVVAQDSGPTGLYFSPDGTKMFIGGIFDAIYRYDLSTAWNVSTASFVASAAVTSNVTGVFFNDAGTRMYVLTLTGNGAFQYNLSTAWDMSTVSYSGNKSAGPESGPTGFYLKDDGLRFFITGTSTDKVFEFDLTVAWELEIVGGAVDAISSLDVTATTSDIGSMAISADGEKLYVVDYVLNKVFRWSMGTDVTGMGFVLGFVTFN